MEKTTKKEPKNNQQDNQTNQTQNPENPPKDCCYMKDKINFLYFSYNKLTVFI